MKFLLGLLLALIFWSPVGANTNLSDKSSELILKEILKEFNIKNTKENMQILSDIKDSITSKDLRDFKKIVTDNPENVSIIKDELDNIDAPYFLLYLAMVESKFFNKATSNMRAGGMWQFMPSTARAFGLKVDKHVDERRDPFASTDTAFKYLDFLNEQFDKWYLSLMAYNCGDGCIRKVLKESEDDDLSVILSSSKTPKETKNFIKRIIKYSIISKREDSKQIFANLKTKYKLEKIVVKPGTKLSDISNSINLDIDIMQKYNLHIKNGEAPKGKDAYYFYIPENKLELYALNYIGDMIKNSNKYSIYKVTKNDTLSQIASRLNITIAEIKYMNNLKDNKILANQELKVPINAKIKASKTKKVDTLIALADKTSIKEEVGMQNSIKDEILVAGDEIVTP